MLKKIITRKMYLKKSLKNLSWMSRKWKLNMLVSNPTINKSVFGVKKTLKIPKTQNTPVIRKGVAKWQNTWINQNRIKTKQNKALIKKNLKIKSKTNKLDNRWGKILKDDLNISRNDSGILEFQNRWGYGSKFKNTFREDISNNNMKREKLIKLNQKLKSYRDRVRLKLISDLIFKLSQNNSGKLSFKLDLLESKKKLKSFLFSLNKEKSLTVLPHLVNKKKLGNLFIKKKKNIGYFTLKNKKISRDFYIRNQKKWGNLNIRMRTRAKLFIPKKEIRVKFESRGTPPALVETKRGSAPWFESLKHFYIKMKSLVPARRASGASSWEPGTSPRSVKEIFKKINSRKSLIWKIRKRFKIIRFINRIKKMNARKPYQVIELSHLINRMEYIAKMKKKKWKSKTRKWKKSRKIKIIKLLKGKSIFLLRGHLRNKTVLQRKKLHLNKKPVKKTNKVLIVNDKGLPRHFPSATQEWFNSIYSYSRNEMRSLTNLDNSVNKLIKTYFTSIPSRKKKKNKWVIRKKPKKIWKWKTNKVYLSKSELKHTSSKVTINLFIYAERHINLTYIYKYLNKENLILSMVKDTGLLGFKNIIDNNPIRAESPEFIKKNRNKFIEYLNLEKKAIMKKNYLEKKISKCYKKKVVFKIIRLKYLYLNNNMITQYITLKLIRKKRNLFKAKRKIFRKMKFPYVNKYDINKIRLARKRIMNDSFRNESHNIRGKHIWDEWKQNQYFRPEIFKPKLNKTYKDYLEYLNYKFPVGIRIGIAGRLTKRNTAARSMKKYTYKGSIKNVDSSFRKSSVSSLRSCDKPNLEFNKVHSLARTGAFTVRSWLSKY